MDLKKLSPRAAAGTGVPLNLKDPATGAELLDKDGKPVTITVLGADAQVVRDKKREIERRRIEGETISEDEAGAEVLATVTVGWSGLAVGNEDPYEFSFENAKRLYQNEDTEWICGQVGPFSRDRRNFVKNRPSG